MDKHRLRSATLSISGPWAVAVRDILVTSIKRGQFPLVLLGLILLSLIWRMSSEDVSKLVFRMVDGTLFGYLLALVFMVGWYFHSRFQRRVIAAELDRLAAERNALQMKDLGSQRMKSSRRR